ncbi:MAG: hypothetical protein NTW08_07915 [Gammaproteobacteria bacterium]|nr:hypothetical protein [Gammaproteobacteria bacterium]
MPKSMTDIRAHIDQHLISGYALLNEEQKIAFEQTHDGQHLIQVLLEDPKDDEPPGLGEKTRGGISSAVKTLGSGVLKMGKSAVIGGVNGFNHLFRRKKELEDKRDAAIEAELTQTRSFALVELKASIHLTRLALAARLQKFIELHRIQLEIFWEIIRVGSDATAQRVLSGYYTQHLMRVSALYEQLLKNPANMDIAFHQLSNDYLRDFLPYLSEQVFGQQMPLELEKPSFFQTIQSSFTAFFLQNKWQLLYRKFKQIGNSHALIQYMGFSTQNEASHLALLDIFNYFEHGGQVDDLRGLFSRIAQLFSPLYREYQDIFRHKSKNGVLKAIRAIIPMLIFVSVVVAILTPLAILGVPDLALFFVTVVAMFIGFGVASLYVYAKEKINQWYLNKRYQDEFDRPEYALNDRLKELFGPEAAEVRGIYIKMLKEAKEKKASYEAQSVLEDEEQRIDRDQNIKRMMALSLEWADLHDNVECSRVEARRIVQSHYKGLYETHIGSLQSTLQVFGQLIQVGMQDNVSETPGTPEMLAKVDDLAQRLEKQFETDDVEICWGLFWNRYRETAYFKSRYDQLAPLPPKAGHKPTQSTWMPAGCVGAAVGATALGLGSLFTAPVLVGAGVGLVGGVVVNELNTRAVHPSRDR